MKNFKKVLALVLVLATLLGLATMASATEYKDADKIAADYDEAVKVLDLIETMQGYPNGEFKPTANITREEAAKLIAIFDNKDADISTYYTSINPFADEKGRWGESYVGYGYRAGIIAGMNANTFAPTANVTGTQFLKMALVTLGYDQEIEGFVGSAWAVNVLSLAKKLGLVDDLADGWKPEAQLTRQEAAQILLNTLKCDTVEYGQEAKSSSFNPSPVYKTKKDNTDGKDKYVGEDGEILDNQNDRHARVIDHWTFGGKIYLTVAGAVKTGEKLYGEFKLVKETSYDAFERPYTKWTYDKDDDKTVEQMKAPKATFTKTVNGCDILVGLGVKETDTKTEKKISSYYVNGKLVGTKDDYPVVLKHTKTPCKAEDKITCGAQGTLTQVFKEEDGTYRITSIDTWLAKVEKVSKIKTARDDHKKGEDAVQLNIFTIANVDGEGTAQTTLENNNAYCDDNKQCDGTFQKIRGTDFVSYNEPEGLAKGDYVLVTYSFKIDEDDEHEEKHLGVQSADVVTAKEGNFTGFKYATVSNDPAQTRIDGEYVNDAVHFHFGFDDATDSDNFGTKGFFYDAYGNVIGMKDGADTSKYAVLDRAWVEFNKGTATLHANVVGLDAKVTEDVIVTDFLGLPADNDDWDTDKFGVTIADLADYFAHYVTSGSAQNYKNFFMVYDYLGKASVNSKNEYSLDRDWDIDKRSDEVSIKFVKGEPTLTINGQDEVIKVNSKTQFLVRTGDVGEGKYIAWTGYTGTDAKSIEATGFDIKMDEDGKYAEVVYLFNLVAYTDGTVTAYVPKDAHMWMEKEGDTTYYALEAYINGVYTELKLNKDAADAHKIRDIFDGAHVGRFYKFRYKEVDGINMATLVMNGSAPTEDFNLFEGYEVLDYSEDGILTVTDAKAIGDTNRKTMALAADCVIYSIREDGGKVVKEDKGLEYAADYIEAGKTVHIDWNDKNDDEVNQIVALYVVEDGD